MITIKRYGGFKNNRLERFAQKVKKAIPVTIKEIGTNLRDNAKNTVPVDTGRLQRSIRLYQVGKESVFIGTAVPYACVFDSHTKVVTEDSHKTIGQIKIGDKVLTQDGLFHKVNFVNRFRAVKKPNLVELICEYRSDKDHKVILTQDHKILTMDNNGCCFWKQAGDFKKGEIVFSPIKMPHNKGIRKSEYITLKCSWCNKEYKVTKNKLERYGSSYCSVECYKQVQKYKNPHIGMKRSEESKIKMRESSKKRFLDNPESHPNRIMAKKGYITKIEKEVKEWLDSINVKYNFQYKIDKFFVDFFIPNLKIIIECDGAYWHKNQDKDIKRDVIIKEYHPDFDIIHLHFADKRFSKNIKFNPLERVYYIQCNPSLNSFINLTRFKPVKIKSIRRFVYKRPFRHGGKFLFDISVEGMHSFIANGIIISNSYVEYGTLKQRAQPYLRPAIETAKKLFPKKISATIQKSW